MPLDPEMLNLILGRLDTQDKAMSEEFKTINLGIQTIHKSMADLKLDQVNTLNETRKEILDNVDGRLTRHKAEHIKAIDTIYDLAQITHNAFVEHKSSPCPGLFSHPKASENGNGNDHGKRSLKSTIMMMAAIAGAASGVALILKWLILIAGTAG